MAAQSTVAPRPIRVLAADLANKIAAGEVVERPASVVKELVENAIDAGATRIEIEVRDGGKEYIRVSDNGCGIARAELPVAFLRHATSKIQSAADLATVLSLGFRGEALPSIASCAEVEILSCPHGASEAARLVVKGGVAENVVAAAGPPGTTVIVRRLFHNTPARYKFLKQAATEKRYIAEYVTNMALAHPEVAFHLSGDNSVMLSTPGTSDLLAAITAVYGAAVARRLIPVAWDSPFLSLSGFVSPPDAARPNRTHETVIVNGRWVQNRLLYAAVEKAYDTMLGHRRYPVAVLHLQIDPSLLDVNVHPAKTEIRFTNESETFKQILLAVRGALTGSNLAPGAYSNRVDDRRPPVVARPASRLAGATPATTVRSAAYPPLPTGAGRVREEAGPTLFPAAPAAPKPQTAAAPPGEIDANDDQLLQHMRSPLAAAEVPAEADAVRDFLRQAPALGQILDTYLAVASPFGLWLIDQHVAHERVLYEQVLARADETRAQQLLNPITVELAPAEAAQLEAQAAALADMGFAVEPFGVNACLVRALPVQLAKAPGAAALRELLVEIASVWEESGPSRRERAAAMIACKAAIKAGRRLDAAAQQALLTALAAVENPFACPHGRPVMLAIDRTEIERRFGRH